MTIAKVSSKTMKSPSKESLVPIFKSLDDIVSAMAEIAVIQQNQAGERLVFEKKVAKLKNDLEEKLVADTKRIEVLFEAIVRFAQARRSELTEEEKKKTVRLPTGDFGWRTNPSSVKLTEKEEEVVASLKKLGLESFVRTIFELNKNEVLSHPEIAKAVKGISIVSEVEMFFVKPLGAEQEFTQRIKAPTKKKK